MASFDSECSARPDGLNANQLQIKANSVATDLQLANLAACRPLIRIGSSGEYWAENMEDGVDPELNGTLITRKFPNTVDHDYSDGTPRGPELHPQLLA